MLGLLYERANLYDTTHDGKELVNSKRFAFMLYIGLTIMLFAGLFGGYFVLRGNNDIWPPLGTPEMSVLKMLPSLVLMIASIFVLLSARKEMRANQLSSYRLKVTIGLLISVLFVFAMGLEWWRLIVGGVGLSSVFGGMYFIVTGAFALHFIGGLYGLVHTLRKARTIPFTTPQLVGFNNTLSFYYLMLLLWAIIVPLIYINS